MGIYGCLTCFIAVRTRLLKYTPFSLRCLDVTRTPCSDADLGTQFYFDIEILLFTNKFINIEL